MLGTDSDIPLYYQLENIIRKKIEKGEYIKGDKIPAERKLSDKFELSRMTVRKALENLVNEGILEKRERQGTFVAQNGLNNFPSLVGINESIAAKGMEASNQILKKELLSPKQEIADELNITTDEKVILIERLNLADGDPLGFEESYIPYAICPELLDREVSNESIYNILLENGHKPTKATDKTEAELAGDREVELLNLEKGAAVLKNIRTTFSKDRPIVFSYNYYRGDQFTLVRTSFNSVCNNK